MWGMRFTCGTFLVFFLFSRFAFSVDFPTVPQNSDGAAIAPDLNFTEFPKPKSETDLDFVAFPMPSGAETGENALEFTDFPKPKNGLLQATVFPKTVKDLSFQARNDLLAEGYEAFADLPAYDILTIVYTDQNIADEIAEDEKDYHEDDEEKITDKKTKKSMFCQEVAPHIPQNQTIPIGKPVLESDYIYCSPYGIRNFGTKENPKYDNHYGFDIGCTESSYNRPVFTTADGIVERVKKNHRGSSAGNYILINHKNGFKTYYMHLNSMLVTPGQFVPAGCQIATIGYTGGAKAFKSALNVDYPQMRKEISHLHYEVHYSGQQTYVTDANGKKIPIVHKFSNNQSIDPAYLMGVKEAKTDSIK